MNEENNITFQANLLARCQAAIDAYNIIVNKYNGRAMDIPFNIAAFSECEVIASNGSKFWTYRNFIMQGMDIKNDLAYIVIPHCLDAHAITLPVKNGIIRITDDAEDMTFCFGPYSNINYKYLTNLIDKCKNNIAAIQQNDIDRFIPTQEEHDTINKMCNDLFQYMKQHNIIFQLNADSANIFKCENWYWDNNADGNSTDLSPNAKAMLDNFKHVSMDNAVIEADSNKLCTIEHGAEYFLLQCECPCILCADKKEKN